MNNDHFPNSSNRIKLAKILSDIRLIQDSQSRYGFLENRGVDSKFWKNFVSGKESINSFVENLIAYLSKEYRDDLDNPIWGFINKKLLLITFLENLTTSESESLSTDDKDFISNNLIKKWQPWYKDELNKYKKAVSEYYIHWHSLINTDEKAKIALSKLEAKEEKLGLEIQEREATWHKIQKERRQGIVPKVLLGLVLGTIFISIIYFSSWIRDQQLKDQQLKDQQPKDQQLKVAIGSTQGWMFVGKITRDSSGNDMLTPPNIYPRMIPRIRAILEVRETTNIRFNHPQAPDFDYAQQALLGCVVPGEKVEVLNVEIVPNQAVWARVQKYGGNPNFLFRCPSNGIRAWW